MSQQCPSSAVVPQGCVPSPLLYILHRNDCRSQYSDGPILKFADDTVIISVPQDGETCHGAVVDEFVQWCDDHFLRLNTAKTKDMVIDFGRSASLPPSQIVVKGQGVDIVESYKCLGTFTDKKLNFDLNTAAMRKEAKQRLHFLRRLNVFDVDRKLMMLFYRSFIESILTFSLGSWYGNLNVKNKKRLNNIVKVGPKDHWQADVLLVRHLL